jgi:predicted Fe-Mo cluster-binding NifX family protein
MKVCISSTGDNLESEVDPRFGRCHYFIIVDTESMKFDVERNANLMARGGVGVQSAQLVSERGVEVVLTGNVGPNAYQTLKAAGIKLITGVSGKVKEQIEEFKTGKLKDSFQFSNVQEDDIDDLKQKAENAKRQLNEINRKIDELERRSK